MKIGIGIASFNRNSVLDKTLAKIKEFAPDNSEIVVVDDGSSIPYPNADFTFPKNQGTPIAKNKCLELLYNKGCDEIFLFDSDCYPIVKGWEKPYIESKEPHLNFTFKYPFEIKNGLRVLQNPNGCMMYINRSVLDAVGGFDTGFIKYGYWHGAFSNRVYNAGLTSNPFMDIIGSDKLFVSMDQKGTVATSRNDRGRYLAANKKRYFEKIDSKEFIPFGNNPKIWYSNPYSTTKNIGRALNEFCEIVPDGDFICLQDGDAMYLTPDWGVQIEKVVNDYGKEYSLIGCVTNRLGRPIQLAKGVDYDNHDIKYHYDIANELRQEYWGEVKDVTKTRYIAGLFMLFPKSVWQKHKFRENCNSFDDEFSKAVIKGGGKLGLMTGLYVYHWYRGWAESPRTDKAHLL